MAKAERYRKYHRSSPDHLRICHMYSPPREVFSRKCGDPNPKRPLGTLVDIYHDMSTGIHHHLYYKNLKKGLGSTGCVRCVATSGGRCFLRTPVLYLARGSII